MTRPRPVPGEPTSRGPETLKVTGLARLRSPRAGVVVSSACLLLVGCVDGPEPRDEGGRMETGNVERPLRPGAGVAVTAHIEPVSCSATLRCQDREDAAAPGVHLVTGLSCAYDGGDGAPPRDTLLAVQRRVRCYFEGDPAVPETWVPAAGEPLVPDEEAAFAATTNAFGDAFFNTASRIDPWDGYAFCRYEAFGTIASTPDLGAARVARHTSGGVVARWEAIIGAEQGGSWACEGDAVLAYAHAVVQSRPSPSTQGDLPATHDAVVLMEAELVSDDPAQPFGVVHGIGLAIGHDTTFPIHDAHVPDLTERRLRVADPEGGTLDVRVTGSCIERDAAGELAALLVAVDERWTGVPLGAVRIAAATDFDCQPDPAEGGCLLIPFDDLPTEAPCLVATAPL
ncbi:MAG: hypothetical protein IT385_02360 [Deltaproteobacteria bacterium]|nr:hypothetical protein [Deltaproteobacteria bacterium]